MTRTLSFLFVFSIGLLGGCSTTHYVEQADREAYDIVTEKSAGLDGMPTQFSLTPPTVDIVTATPTNAATQVISLPDAIRLGVQHSRDYQSRRESLFASALSLAATRHDYGYLPDAGATGTLYGEDNGYQELDSTLSLGLRKILATGGDLSVQLLTALNRILDGDSFESAISTFSLSLIQPLWRGAGHRIAFENLTQAERDMVYAIRSHIRYRRQFSVGIAQQYFNLLQQHDQRMNAQDNYAKLQQEAERVQLMSRAGRMPQFQVDQTRQDVLAAHERYIQATERYENALDEFKLTLGLPTDLPLEPDPAALVRVASAGVVPVAVTLDEAIATALANRLDLATSRDRVRDASRKVTVAANQLGGVLDFTATYGADTEPDKTVVNWRDGEQDYSAGLALELPVDRLDERNSYRLALLDWEASQRDYTEQVDRIKLDVRNTYRNLLQAEESYRIQQNALTLARRRVESTTLLQQAGRASTRDLLEAREDLLDAQDAVTDVLVAHFNARLDLAISMESLRIDDRGLWPALNAPTGNHHD